MLQNKFLWIGLGVLALGVFLGWLFIESSKPLPGTKIADLGRGHVPVGTQVDYNSNPPTSGKHYDDWIRAGVYSEPKDDRNLVHSLEHGYVIVHYKCTPPVIPSTSEGSLTNVSTDSNKLRDSSSFDKLRTQNDNKMDTQTDCDQKKSQLEQVYNKKGKHKLIVVPRSNLDTNFALTAWTYLDKFNEFNEQRVTSFIDVHRDNGPERTME